MSDIVGNNIDDSVDIQIIECLNADNPKSFFLFAGAGSGKTRSLVNAISKVREIRGKELRLNGQHIGVITYTNAACNEIKQRLDFDPLIEVTTTHSFSWLLIKGFHSDIKKWLKTNLENEICELEEKQRKGRTGTKAALDRDRSIKSKNKRLSNLGNIKKFTYNPNGGNRERDSLNHSEVIKITSDFLVEKPLMQRILIGRFPVLLIDESQDTNKYLMNALFEVQKHHSDSFSLGLLGDTMQRIYADGKVNLGKDLPDDWLTPIKKMNHRSSRRIIKLINKIRSFVDKQEQIPRVEKKEGFVRLFILPSGTSDKVRLENIAAQKMAEVTNDPLWNNRNAEVKTLILEHHMAAKRMGFLDMYEPLYKSDRLKMGLLDGKLSGLRLFSNIIYPLINAKNHKDEFAVASIIREFSPLLKKSTLKLEGNYQLLHIKKVRKAIDHLLNLWSDGKEPIFLDVLNSIAQTKLFEIPETLHLIAQRSEMEQQLSKELSDLELADDDSDLVVDAWDQFLQTPFSQIEPYTAYISGDAPFDTHQGVKGLEFPRVMVIVDDNEARGFLFSYDKLFGSKDKTEADLKNENEGRDTSIERTRRLFYVTCSRAEESLAIIAYSMNPEKVRAHVISEGWFDENEVELLT